MKAAAPTHIGIRYLRDNMRTLIERMDQGEYFVILRHNHPVGALIPYDALIEFTTDISRLSGRYVRTKRPLT